MVYCQGEFSDQAKCLPQRLLGADEACPGLHAPAAAAAVAAASVAAVAVAAASVAAAAVVLLVVMQPAQCCMLEKQLLSCQLLFQLLVAAVAVSRHD